MKNVWRDVRYAFRVLRKNPGFTLATILSLGLGIGANTAIFSLMNTLLLSPLPFENEAGILRIRDVLERPGKEPRMVGVSSQNYVFLKETVQSFVTLGAQTEASFNLVTEEPTRVQGAVISHELLPILGIEPILGRRFQADDDRPGAPARVALLGYDLWHRHFGGNPDVLGESVTINAEPYTVVGIMPPYFKYPYDAELWAPLGIAADSTPAAQHSLNVLGRLAPGSSREKAQQELDLFSQLLAQEQPDTHAGWSTRIVSLREDLTGNLQPRLFFALLAATGFLLLIACANVANMLLSRSLKSRGEMAMRVALGASRRRLVQQLVTQGLVLAFLSGAVGTLLAFWTLKPVIALSPVADMNAVFHDIRIDYRVLGFTVAVSLLVGVLFSLVPALMAARPDLQGFLREGSRATVSPRSRRILAGFVVVEIAVAVVLLVGASLMIRSFQSLLEFDVGYSKQNRLILHLSLPTAKYPEGRQKVDFVRQMLEHVRTLPNVLSAGVTTTHPLDVIRVGTLYSVEGQPPASADEMLVTNHRLVTPDYLKATGIPVLQGRSISEQDREDTAGVVVISKNLAETHWPGLNPVGRRIKRGRWDSDAPFMEVVGVAGDVDDDESFDKSWYLPIEQRIEALLNDNVTLVVETRGDPMEALPTVRAKIWELDDEQPIWGVGAVGDMIEANYREQRFSAHFFSLFAALGLTLAVLGIYGILSYTVAQQTHEIGLRLVLGAQARDLLQLILLKGLGLGLLGVVIGLASAVALTRFLASLLYEISPTDPPTLVVVSLVILLVALVASFVPARRAMRTHPMSALRYE